MFRLASRVIDALQEPGEALIWVAALKARRAEQLANIEQPESLKPELLN